MEFTIGQAQSWREGRRIVSLQELAKQMRCKHCKALLDLNQVIKETRFGLASILYIMCQCGLLNDVHTGKRQEGDGSRHLFEVNIKASINLLLYGIGAQNIIHFLQTGLDIPLPPPEDNSLVLPMHSTPDMSTSLPVTMATYNPPITAPLPHQLQVGQHPPLNPQLQHQHHHHQHQQQQQHHHQQQQHQVVNVPQVKDVFRVAQAGLSKGGVSQSAGHKGSEVRCLHCRPCPQHTQADPTTHTGPSTHTHPPKKVVEKVKLTKDERDDLKVNTKCTVCKIVFRSREHFRMHKILHPQINKKQRVKCSQCSAEFPDRSKLRQHSKVHCGGAKEKPFQCQLCEKSFHKKSQRSKHVKRCHMKENSHVCHVCGKRTFTKSELREHVRIHTGERPYQCEVCERAFRRKDYLTIHMRQHTGLKPYSCEQCGESFVQRASLCKHLQTKHAVSTTEGVSDVIQPSLMTHQPQLTHTITQDSMATTMPILHNALFYQ